MIPITRPDIGDEEEREVVRVLRSGWVMQGPEVAAFEAEFAAAVGAPHAVAVSNGTVAIELALRLCGVGRGDEVITVSHSFLATANAVVAVGASPVFVDVEAQTFGMDPRRIAAAITPRTRAVLCVHQMGFACDVDGVLEAAGALPVVEDAACALGTELFIGGGWERIGRPRGRIATFSFHPRKVVTTGDGGMLTMADAALAARARLLRNHAMTAEGFAEPGFNMRLTDLQAAMGRTQLRRLDKILAERRRLAEVFGAALARSSSLLPFRPRADCRPNWQSLPALVREGASPEDTRARLERAGIATRRGISNAHQEPAYPALLSLPVSEHLRERTLLLPLFHGMSPAEEEAMVAALGDL
jgi:dTDP-4-amino-4,6-dideoxygalactose transaminase